MAISSDTQNVISIAKWLVPPRFPALGQIQAYWRGLQVGDSVPFRSELDPRGILTALEFAFVLERIAPGVVRFRIAGMHLNTLLGMEVRGMPMSAMFDAGSRGRLSRTIEDVCLRPCTATMVLKSPGGLGRRSLNSRIFLAPLRDDAMQITRILGCMQTNGTIGRAPRRFTLVDVSTEIVGNRVISAPQPMRKTALSGFGESDTDFAHAAPSPSVTERVGLRLVADND